MFYKVLTFTVITILTLAACNGQGSEQAPATPNNQPSGQEPAPTPSPAGQGQPGQPQAYPGLEGGGAQPNQPVMYPGLGQPAPYPGVGQPGATGTTYVPPAPSDYSPQPGDAGMERGQVFLELVDSQIRTMESYPVQVVVVLRGNLPNGCHKLRAVVNAPDAANTVQLEVYTVVDTSQMCAEVLAPFEVPISLGSFAGGSFTVIVNGEVLGKFDA